MKPRTVVGVLVGIAALAFALRALPLTQRHGALGRADFDDGVYFSAAALLVKGMAPYGEFVFLHPPGIVLALAPIAVVGDQIVGYADAFAGARWLTCLVGAANALLVGLAAFRWCGASAAFVAAALYAVFPPAVRTEGMILLEPFVNLAMLGAALAWLGRGTLGAIDRRAVVTGVLVGVAATFKLYGGIGLLAALVAPPLKRVIRDRVGLVLSAAASFLAVVVPFALWGGVGEFVGQVIGAQLGRPSGDVEGGEIGGVLERGLHMLYYAPDSPERLPSWLGAILLALGFGIALWAWKRGGRDGRFWSAMWAVTAALLLLAPSYYDQYPVVLAPATSVLAGAAAHSLMRVRFAPVRVGVVVAAFTGPLLTSLWFVNEERHRKPITDFGEVVKREVPKGACLYADPPVLAVAGDRLPGFAGGANPLIDPFGELVYLAYERGGQYDSMPDALMADAAQNRLQQVLRDCRFVALHGRSDDYYRWSSETRAQFRANFELTAASRGTDSTLWTHRRGR